MKLKQFQIYQIPSLHSDVVIGHISMNYRVRYSRGRVSNLPLLLAEEGSQITTFGGRRVSNFAFLTQNFWREKGLKSQQIGGRRVSNEDFTPLKVAV